MNMPLIVPKLWGTEYWLVGEAEYYFKILEVKKGTAGSLHYHPKKKETFILQKGKVKLEVDGLIKILDESKIIPITILPGMVHRFTGLEDSLILEVSTCHSDDDVVRLETSKEVVKIL